MDAIHRWHFRADCIDRAHECDVSEDAGEAFAWRQVASLTDDAIDALIKIGPCANSLSAQECLDIVERAGLPTVATKTERDAKRSRGLGAKTLAARAHVVDVLNNFDGSMAVRQIYYQLISRGAVANNASSYESVSRLLVKMRRDGTIPYGRIVDRTRRVHKLAGWAGVREAMTALATQYRRDPWNDQEVHVHICCEKQALEGVFGDVVDEYGAPLYTIRGFISEGFMYEWATEIARATDAGHRVAVVYFGDYDPSGLSLERNCRERLERYIERPISDWQRAGLLWDDLETYNLINVPVKRGDSRTRAYLKDHGDRAAELDALPPEVLRGRVRDAIRSRVDTTAWDRIATIERAETESLNVVTNQFEAALAAARCAA